MTETTTPKVYAAVHAVLKELQVDKTQTLPGNMGGKKYAPASAVSNEVKRLFVKHNLILETREELNQHENINVGDRTRISVSITGHYKAVHIEDGSFVEFGGIGDGLATGTAVASNIASTNALKNGLLRFLLISEDSVEEESLKEQATPKTTAAQRTASTKAAAPKATKTPASAISKVNYQGDILALIQKGDITRDQVAALEAKLLEETPGAEKADVLPELHKRLTNGEVA